MHTLLYTKISIFWVNSFLVIKTWHFCSLWLPDCNKLSSEDIQTLFSVNARKRLHMKEGEGVILVHRGWLERHMSYWHILHISDKRGYRNQRNMVDCVVSALMSSLTKAGLFPHGKLLLIFYSQVLNVFGVKAFDTFLVRLYQSQDISLVGCLLIFH